MVGLLDTGTAPANNGPDGHGPGQHPLDTAIADLKAVNDLLGRHLCSPPMPNHGPEPPAPEPPGPDHGPEV
jgi:hypothetical protein